MVKSLTLHPVGEPSDKTYILERIISFVRDPLSVRIVETKIPYLIIRFLTVPVQRNVLIFLCLRTKHCQISVMCTRIGDSNSTEDVVRLPVLFTFCSLCITHRSQSYCVYPSIFEVERTKP